MKWEETLKKKLRVFHLEPRNLGLYRRAFSHASYSNEKEGGSYERLEFLGDSVLDLFLSERCYMEFRELSEGYLSRVKSCLNTSSVLSEFAEALNFDEMIFVGHGQRHDKAGFQSIRSDVFEAFIAAIYLENGIEPTKRFLGSLYDPYFERMKNESLESIFGLDYKTVVQEKLHEIYHKTPKYKVDAKIKTKEGERFKVSLWIDAKMIAESEGESKKKAEISCAKKAYERYFKTTGEK